MGKTESQIDRRIDEPARGDDPAAANAVGERSEGHRCEGVDHVIQRESQDHRAAGQAHLT